MGRARMRWAMSLASLVLLAAGCGASGSSGGEEGEGDGPATTEASGGDSVADFGDIESPCGPGEATVEESEAGRGTDKLYIGVNSDKGSQVRPGLLRELWDASNAYVDWCNEQGGIAGLEVELVDLDGKLTEVPQYLPTACEDVFAMVGGGTTLDSLQLEGPTNLKDCGQLDMPGFTVTKQKAEATDTYIAALPNPAFTRPAAMFQFLAEAYPDEAGEIATVYGDLDSIAFVRDQTNAALEKLGPPLGVGDQIAYAVVGQDFKLISQRLKGSGATMGTYVGEPGNFGLLLKSMKEDGVDIPMFGEANLYDPLVLGAGSNPLGDALVRIPHPPFEEADDFPAITKFIELMDAREAEDPEAKTAALGIQSMSSWLLFTEAATACGSNGDQVISRDCIREEVAKIGEWTGGGLHAPTNPGESTPAACIIVMKIDGDGFSREFPELGSDDATEDGYYCPEENGIVEIDLD